MYCIHYHNDGYLIARLVVWILWPECIFAQTVLEVSLRLHRTALKMVHLRNCISIGLKFRSSRGLCEIERRGRIHWTDPQNSSWKTSQTSTETVWFQSLRPYMKMVNVKFQLKQHGEIKSYLRRNKIMMLLVGLQHCTNPSCVRAWVARVSQQEYIMAPSVHTTPK